MDTLNPFGDYYKDQGYYDGTEDWDDTSEYFADTANIAVSLLSVGKAILAVPKLLSKTGRFVKTAPKTGGDFFKGAKYTDKVKGQMSNAKDARHVFPNSVDGFANKYGKQSTFKGGDGKTYQKLEMKGGYKGQNGTFEYIKDGSGNINHRFLKP